MRERAMTSSPTRFISESSRSTLTRMLARADGAALHAATAGSMASEVGSSAKAPSAIAGSAGTGSAASAGVPSAASTSALARDTVDSSPDGRALATASMRRTASALANTASTVAGVKLSRPSRTATRRSSTRWAKSPIVRQPTV